MAIQTVVAVGLVVLISQILASTHYVQASGIPIQIQNGKQARGVPIPGPNPNNPTNTTTTATTPTTTTTTTSTTTTPNPAGASSKTITQNQNALEYINRVRMSHHAPPLTYDPALQVLAKNCARNYALQILETATEPMEPIQEQAYLKFQCDREQTGGGNELILTVLKADVEKAGAIKTAFKDKYTKAIAKPYNFQKPKSSELGEDQYLTQMLWKSSTKMGCACEPDPESTKMRRACSCIFTPEGNTRFGYSSAGLADYITNVQAK